MFVTFRNSTFHDDDESLDGAAAGMEARLEQGLGAPAAEDGDPDAAAVPPPDADFDPFSDAALDQAIPADMRYEDAAKLRGDLARVRDRYRPLHDTYGGLDDDARDALARAIPQLGNDAGRTAAVLAQLQPDERGYFLDLLELAIDDPSAAAPYFDEIAANMRGAAGAATGVAPVAPSPPAAPPAEPGEEAPLTRAEFEAELDARAEQARYEQEVAQHQQVVLQELRDLGYRPESEQEADLIPLRAVMDVAARNGGNLQKAHQAVQDWRQAEVDAFVAAKQADAGRPPALGTPGAAPNQERTIETFDDAEASMEARIAAALGPDPRGRR